MHPWPVEIINEQSFSWLAPVIGFLGSVLLFTGLADRARADQ
jgi:hypothetical protein